jgi:hypothetical protein
MKKLSAAREAAESGTGSFDVDTLDLSRFVLSEFLAHSKGITLEGNKLSLLLREISLACSGHDIASGECHDLKQ